VEYLSYLFERVYQVKFHGYGNQKPSVSPKIFFSIYALFFTHIIFRHILRFKQLLKLRRWACNYWS